MDELIERLIKMRDEHQQKADDLTLAITTLLAREPDVSTREPNEELFDRANEPVDINVGDIPVWDDDNTSD